MNVLFLDPDYVRVYIYGQVTPVQALVSETVSCNAVGVGWVTYRKYLINSCWNEASSASEVLFYVAWLSKY